MAYCYICSCGNIVLLPQLWSLRNAVHWSWQVVVKKYNIDLTVPAPIPHTPITKSTLNTAEPKMVPTPMSPCVTKTPEINGKFGKELEVILYHHLRIIEPKIQDILVPLLGGHCRWFVGWFCKLWIKPHSKHWRKLSPEIPSSKANWLPLVGFKAHSVWLRLIFCDYSSEVPQCTLACYLCAFSLSARIHTIQFQSLFSLYSRLIGIVASKNKLLHSFIIYLSLLEMEKSPLIFKILIISKSIGMTSWVCRPWKQTLAHHNPWRSTLNSSPITDAKSSGAELPKAMKVAPATSDWSPILSQIISRQGTK